MGRNNKKKKSNKKKKNSKKGQTQYTNPVTASTSAVAEESSSTTNADSKQQQPAVPDINPLVSAEFTNKTTTTTTATKVKRSELFASRASALQQSAQPSPFEDIKRETDLCAARIINANSELLPFCIASIPMRSNDLAVALPQDADAKIVVVDQDSDSHDHVDGRRPREHVVVATRDLEAGDLICVVRAITVQVLPDFHDAICARCIKMVDPSHAVTCNECQYATYCSRACHTRHADEHARFCKLIPLALTKIAPTYGVSPSLLLAAISTASKKPAPSGQKHTPVQMTSAQETLEFPYEQVLEYAPPASSRTDQMRQAAVQLAQHFDNNVTAEELVHIMTSFNNYSQEVCIDAPVFAHRTGCAAGLFSAPYFSHSCDPNAFYVNSGTRLWYRAVRPIAAGEEITIPYIDLLQPRWKRRRELVQQKAFWCECPRCSNQPRFAGDAKHYENDALLGAVVCKAFAEISDDGKTISQSDCSGFMVPVNKATVAEDIEYWKSNDAPHTYQCTKCQRTVLGAKVNSLVSHIVAMYNTAAKVFQQPFESRADVEKCLRMFQHCQKLCREHLHPYHDVTSEVLEPIRQLGIALQKADEACQAAHALTTRAQAILHETSPALCTALQGHAEANAMQAHLFAGKTSTATSKRLRAKVVQSLQQLYRIHANLFGVAHPASKMVYQQVQAAVEHLKKLM
jgi:SET domain